LNWLRQFTSGLSEVAAHIQPHELIPICCNESEVQKLHLVDDSRDNSEGEKKSTRRDDSEVQKILSREKPPR
jgi:hypothetical protein